MIYKLIKNKDIAIVGNAKSVFNKKRDIDNHDVVIRLNRGFPKVGIGNRTDILGLSSVLTQKEIKRYNPKAILWCTPKHELMTDYLKKVAYIFPKSSWVNLESRINARPSTGLMMIYYVLSSCKSITLYGFDFWNSNTWYSNENRPGPHNPKSEEQFIRQLTKVKIIQ